MKNLIELPIEELRERVQLIERAAVASRVVSVDGLAAIANADPAAPDAAETKPAPKKRAPRKKAAPKAAPKEEKPADEPEDDTSEDQDDAPQEDDAVDVEEIKDAARNVVRMKRSDVLKKLTAKYKVKRITDADPKHFPAILKVLLATEPPEED